jgi:hypothetical protein
VPKILKEGLRMKKAVGAITLLFLAGFLVMPAIAAELRVTGFFDNIIPRVESNNSEGDLDMTRNDDQATFGRERSRLFFNFIASDDLRGVFALELDNVYGAPRRSVSGRCIQGSGAFANEQCGFRNGIDVNNFELKHLYVDFRVPQLPIGNRWRLGGLPFDATPLHPSLLYTMDAGGGDVVLTLNDQVAVQLMYVQLEEDLDRFVGSTKIGEDYITGGSVRLNPISGLELNLIGVYGHGQTPFGPALVGNGGPFNAVAGDTINVTTESRYYLGFDSRYRMGNTTIEPTFIYLLGTRNFVDGTNADFRAFETQLVFTHTMGPWLLRAKGAYASGNSAGDDINDRGNGRRADVKGFRPLGVDGFHRFGEWFEILGRSEVDATGGTVGPVSPGESGTFDRFGWWLVGGNVEFKWTDSLVIEGAAGGFWTPNVPRCPASIRTASGGCGGPSTSAGTPALNFTGNSTYAGTEVAAGLRYTIMPGLTYTPRFAWAFLGDAWNTNNRTSADAWVFVNRIIYTF